MEILAFFTYGMAVGFLLIALMNSAKFERQTDSDIEEIDLTAPPWTVGYGELEKALKEQMKSRIPRPFPNHKPGGPIGTVTDIKEDEEGLTVTMKTTPDTAKWFPIAQVKGPEEYIISVNTPGVKDNLKGVGDKRRKLCPICAGIGSTRAPYQTKTLICNNCRGSGLVDLPLTASPIRDIKSASRRVTCNYCDGLGGLANMTRECFICNGDGFLTINTRPL